MAIEVRIRPYDPGPDDGYIYSTWTKFAWYSPKQDLSQVKKRDFFQTLSNEIKSILSFGVTKVACIKEAPEVILGYIVVHKGKIQWICIKKDYRDQGIDQLLLKSVKEHLYE